MGTKSLFPTQQYSKWWVQLQKFEFSIWSLSWEYIAAGLLPLLPQLPFQLTIPKPVLRSHLHCTLHIRVCFQRTPTHYHVTQTLLGSAYVRVKGTKTEKIPIFWCNFPISFSYISWWNSGGQVWITRTLSTPFRILTSNNSFWQMFSEWTSYFIISPKAILTVSKKINAKLYIFNQVH